MLISDAQREVRSIYISGSVGQLVSGVMWLFRCFHHVVEQPFRNNRHAYRWLLYLSNYAARVASDGSPNLTTSRQPNA